MITRAVDLSHPVDIIYPVRKAGFYCAATFGFTASSYKASMSLRNYHGKLPASQIPALEFHKFLAIMYTVGYAVWLFLRPRGLPRSFLPRAIAVITTLTLCQLLARWAFLEFMNRVSDEHIPSTLTWINAGLRVAQYGSTMWLVVGLVALEADKLVSIMSAVIHLGALGLSGLLDFVISLSAPLASAIAIGVVVMAGFVCAFLHLRKVFSEVRRSRSIPRIPLRFWTCWSFIVIVTCIVAVDAAFLLSKANDRNFTPDFWHVRWIIMDEPINNMFLLWAVYLGIGYSSVLRDE